MASEAAGIDAFRRGKTSGWVAVVLSGPNFARARLDTSLEALLAELGGAAVIGIDMPIGLPSDGARPCDEAAREFVGVRRSSVFRTPPRAALLAPNHAEATKLCAELTGVGMSQQSFGLRVKLLELEPLAEADDRLVEVHPEVSFAEMAGEPVGHPKSSWSGQMLRRRLLAEEGIELPEDLGEAGVVPPDDLLDAAAAAWSAMRVSAGVARPLPDGAEPGAPMTIWR